MCERAWRKLDQCNSGQQEPFTTKTPSEAAQCHYGLKIARIDDATQDCAGGQLRKIEQCRNVSGAKQHGESWIEAILANKNHLLQKLGSTVQQDTN